MITIDYLSSAGNNLHTRSVMNMILEKIEQDWVTTINDCPREEYCVLTNPEGHKLIRLFATSSEYIDGIRAGRGRRGRRDYGHRLRCSADSDADPQKPAKMNRERLTDFIAEINETLSSYPDYLSSVKRMYGLLAQLFHLMDNKDIIQFLPQKSELIISLSCPDSIEFHPTCLQWLLNARRFDDTTLKDLGYVILPFGTYEPVYEFSEHFILPEPFASVAAAFDIYDIYQEKMEDTFIEVRAYNHPTKAGYSIMCLTKNENIV